MNQFKLFISIYGHFLCKILLYFMFFCRCQNFPLFFLPFSSFYIKDKERNFLSEIKGSFVLDLPPLDFHIFFNKNWRGERRREKKRKTIKKKERKSSIESQQRMPLRVIGNMIFAPRINQFYKKSKPNRCLL